MISIWVISIRPSSVRPGIMASQESRPGAPALHPFRGRLVLAPGCCFFCRFAIMGYPIEFLPFGGFKAGPNGNLKLETAFRKFSLNNVIDPVIFTTYYSEGALNGRPPVTGLEAAIKGPGQ